MRFSWCHHSKRESTPATWRGRGGRAAALALAALAMLFGVAPARAARVQDHSSKQISQPVMNRYMAERDVEVGTFYLKKGKYDAAISRYRSAITHDPHWAKPHRLLGKAYDKKDDRKLAIEQYKIFLKITPYAKDAKKIQKRVDKLTAELKKEREQSQ